MDPAPQSNAARAWETAADQPAASLNAFPQEQLWRRRRSEGDIRQVPVVNWNMERVCGPGAQAAR
eukprot:8489056-Pyramimonas_sp.AAC.1